MIDEDKIATIKLTLSNLAAGHPIKEADLKTTIKWLQNLVENLQILGPEYRLFIADIRRKLYTLEGYADARARV